MSSDIIKEYCGVVGVYGSNIASKLVFLGLYALQHRGQESAGIASSNGKKIYYYKNHGLVKDVFNEQIISELKGHIAIGHNRYSTTGSTTNFSNIQPIVINYKKGQLAVVHNGNIPNAHKIRIEMEEEGHIFQSTSDSEVVLHLIAKSKKSTIEEMIIDAVKKLQGAFSIIFMTEDKLIAVRDPRGYRPLALGKLKSSYIVASETCAFDIVGAEYIRDIEPGEMVVIDSSGVKSIKYSEENTRKAYCVFELIYFSRPDSIIFGEYCDLIRRKLGAKLYEEDPIDADIVIPVPDSANTIALGFSQRSGIPFEMGLLRNHYVGRTFIQPHQSLRDFKVLLKFNPIKHVIEGKRVVLIDDSIVRGTTIKKLAKILRKAGAKEVHLRIGSPPIKYPCYFGMDFPSKEELIAHNMKIDEIEKFLEVDSLKYLSLEGLKEVVAEEKKQSYCFACFSGEYYEKVDLSVDKDIFEK